MILRSGDRFKNNYTGSIWEYTHTDCTILNWGVCIVGDSEHKPGDSDWWGFEGTIAWEFIGNFSKASNFNNLYDKLNETAQRG